MSQFGGKDSKRHFTVVMGGKEHGLYVSSTPSSAAKKAVTKLCAANKSKKVEFSIREITQGSKKKTYGPYSGHIEKLKEPIELKGRVIKYKPVAKLSDKSGEKKGGMMGGNMTYEEFKQKYIQYYYDPLNHSKKWIEYFNKYYPQFVAKWKEEYLPKKSNQDLYLEKFPKKFQDMIILKKNPRQNSYNIEIPKNKQGHPIKINNKQNLINFIENYPYSQDLINALNMDVTLLQKNPETIKQAILDKINEFDP
jgi:hypothetical protein